MWYDINVNLNVNLDGESSEHENKVEIHFNVHINLTRKSYKLSTWKGKKWGSFNNVLELENATHNVVEPILA